MSKTIAEHSKAYRARRSAKLAEFTRALKIIRDEATELGGAWAAYRAEMTLKDYPNAD